MSFLQPALLLALPLVAMPIIIHLINQRRHQTVHWGAMMFLLEAAKMSRGYARLRYWFIMLMRMLAIAALLIALSRPLTGGLLGLAGSGRPDTAVVLIDRSPSMEQRTPSGQSKREFAIERLVEALKTLEPKRTVLIDSVTMTPIDLENVEDLIGLPATSASSQSADLAAMLQATQDFIASNEPGQCDVWIASDLRASDWSSQDGRWSSLREGFLEYPGELRFRLVSQSELAPENLSIRILEAVRVQGDKSEGPGTPELSLSLEVSATEESSAGEMDSVKTIQISIEVDGAPSSIDVDMVGPTYSLIDYRIPLDPLGEKEGFCVVRIPVDENPSDNQHYAVYNEPRLRKTVVLSDDEQVARPILLASSISHEPNVHLDASWLKSDQVGLIPWDEMALLVWHSSFPDSTTASQINRFVEKGGRILCMPTDSQSPSSQDSGEFLGHGWELWEEGASASKVSVQSWRGDSDLLERSRSGASLPLGELEIHRYRHLIGDGTTLARLSDGAPLLNRESFGTGMAYFLATTPATRDSSLASNGVVLYVMLQRALESGANSRGDASNYSAGQWREDTLDWRSLSGSGGLSNQYASLGGVYRTDDGLISVNRTQSEDVPTVIPLEKTSELFDGLNFSTIEGGGQGQPILREIWRLLLLLMMIVMVVEAIMCLPKKVPSPIESSNDSKVGVA